MNIPILPNWTKGVSGRMMLFSCDIHEFFQYKKSKTNSAVAALIRDGYIPEPRILKDLKMQGNKRATKKYWLLSDIRELRESMLDKQA